jgi:hypothetical protein
MQLARSEATAVLKIAEEAMKAQHDMYGAEEPKLETDNLVWLEGKHLKTQYPLAKLAPKQYGPFKINKEIGLGSYQLELPKHMRIHPVFHASLLTPYKETNAHDPNFRRPLPDIIERKEEFEVQEICGVRRFGKRKQGQYLVKWKGYPDLENTWEPMTNLRRSHDLITEWHKANPEKPRPNKLTAVFSRFPSAEIVQLEQGFVQLAQHILRICSRGRDYKRSHSGPENLQSIPDQLPNALSPLQTLLSTLPNHQNVFLYLLHWPIPK